MMIKKLLFIALLFTLGHAHAQSGNVTSADAILHIWESAEKDSKIQFLKNGNTYDAKILYGKELFEADGKTYKRDVNNPDSTLRSRLLKDYILISGLVYRDDKWVNGKIYYFKDGNSYDVNMELKDGILYMRAFKGIPMFGRTLKWHQLQ